MTIEKAGQSGEATHHPSARPVVFVLPGLAGDQDPVLEGFWGPTRSVFDLVPIAYLDWTDLIAARCDGEALARHVNQQIKSRVPQGPIRMAGYSIGGHLAYSTAAELEAQGFTVNSVVILDAPLHLDAAPQPFRVRLRERLKDLLSFNLRGGIASIVAKLLVRERCRPLLSRFSRYPSASKGTCTVRSRCSWCGASIPNGGSRS